MDVHAYIVLLNIFAFLRNFVTLQSPQADEIIITLFTLTLDCVPYIFQKN